MPNVGHVTQGKANQKPALRTATQELQGCSILTQSSWQSTVIDRVSIGSIGITPDLDHCISVHAESSPDHYRNSHAIAWLQRSNCSEPRTPNSTYRTSRPGNGQHAVLQSQPAPHPCLGHGLVERSTALRRFPLLRTYWIDKPSSLLFCVTLQARQHCFWRHISRCGCSRRALPPRRHQSRRGDGDAVPISMRP